MPGSVYQGNDMIMKMKCLGSLTLVLAINLLFVTCSSAQTQQGSANRSTFGDRLRQLRTADATRAASNHFDLTFKGGTPKEFVEAIKKQSGLSVNVIIPTEYASAKLPPIEVHNVTVPQVFEALTACASGKKEVTRNTPAGRTKSTEYFRRGFSAGDKNPSENSIWYFVHENTPSDDPVPPEPVSVQVFQLASLLKDHSIDDITTAIKTTWGMLDASTKPEMKYHAETNLLIVKATAEQLQVVNQVLNQLDDTFTENQQLRRSQAPRNLSRPPSGPADSKP